MFDLDSYLARIGLCGRPDLAQVHRAHATSIPFENLDPQCGVPVSLELEDLERKLVGERRGGYCFEQNLLLKAALEALGAEVELFLARVRYRAQRGATRPRGHLVMRAQSQGESWLADVGFGLGSLLEPLPFTAGAAQEQSGWSFRVVQDSTELVLQSVEDGEWVDLYGFVPQPVPLIDVETSNWWVSTHPRSPFVTGLIVSAQDGEGRRTDVSDWGELVLTERTPQHTQVTSLAREELPQLLAARFGLGGFALDAEGKRLVQT
ncbi:MAG TPA: arylamine N-acetyltransferase [Solirubrobacteraceae bacterium]|jgi:N-hydroxyarylamine O-acetyltransferase|nr:arylamine N-acetyltransferase [Solirubrobacteraceae bacterium]